MKVKPHILNAFVKVILFKNIYLLFIQSFSKFEIYNYFCIYSDYTYNYMSMNKAIVTHIRIDHIHIYIILNVVSN